MNNYVLDSIILNSTCLECLSLKNKYKFTEEIRPALDPDSSLSVAESKELFQSKGYRYPEVVC